MGKNDLKRCFEWQTQWRGSNVSSRSVSVDKKWPVKLQRRGHRDKR